MLIRLSHLGFLLCLATVVACPQKKKAQPNPEPTATPVVAVKVEDRGIPGIPPGIPRYSPPPTPEPAPTAKPDKAVKVTDKTKVKVPDPPARPPRWDNFRRDTSEKAIPADPNVAVKLCVSDGDVKINGTEKNEVRVFVRNGRKFEFRSLEKNPETQKANWVWLARATDSTPAAGQFVNCLSGDSIEIDLPLRGSVMIEGRSATVSIDSVTKATVKLIEGDISLRNIPGGVFARTEQGELFAESIAGDIGLETTTGNIVAYDLKTARPGDPLKVSTIRGSISLQNISHRQIDANATSGSVKYVGTFIAGGIYKFRSASGRIGLLLPADLNCTIKASFGYGNFDSAFPIKIITENVLPGGKVIVGQLGTGKGPEVNLSTTSGSIRLVKQGEVDLP